MTLSEEQRLQVEANMGLIGKVLKDKLRGGSALGVYTHEDLFQIGCVGLCKAVAEDKKTGCFSTFAYRLIWNEICAALVLGNRYAMHEAPTEDPSEVHHAVSEFASSNSRLELEELQRRLSRDAPAGIRKGMQVLILKAHGYTSKEIGVQLQLPANAVRTLASRTRAYIRKLPEYAAYAEGGLV